MVWSLALRPDDAKQDPVVYGTKFGVVFLAEGPRTAYIQKGFDCFALYHPVLEKERDFRLAVRTKMLLLKFFWCSCMAINVTVEYNGGLLPDIILLTRCYYHRGTRLNTTKMCCLCSL